MREPAWVWLTIDPLDTSTPTIDVTYSQGVVWYSLIALTIGLILGVPSLVAIVDGVAVDVRAAAAGVAFTVIGVAGFALGPFPIPTPVKVIASIALGVAGALSTPSTTPAVDVHTPEISPRVDGQAH